MTLKSFSNLEIFLARFHVRSRLFLKGQDQIFVSAHNIYKMKAKYRLPFLSVHFERSPYDQWSVFEFIDWASDQMADQRRSLDGHQNRFTKVSRICFGCKMISKKKIKISSFLVRWPDSGLLQICDQYRLLEWDKNTESVCLHLLLTYRYEPILLSWLVLNLWHESNNKVPSEPVDKVKRQIKLSLFRGTCRSSGSSFLGIFMAFETIYLNFLIDGLGMFQR